MSRAAGAVRALVLGAPASGKGTVSSRIVRKYQLQHVASGDRLRHHIMTGTKFGTQVKAYLDEGKLVPDDLVIKFMLDELARVEGSWLLDGFPRTAVQAEQLWKLQPVDFAINLNVPFDVIVDRVKGRWVHLPSGRVYNIDFNAPKVPGKDDETGEDLVQRPDDKPEAVMKRLQIYKEMTEPLIDFYNKLGILEEFKGSTTDEIWPQVVQFLDVKLKQ
ncbi:adenylate kinase 3 [Arctopsyche grandis]|uniref:adenylate kinase 3 n=1 Tax=Arctopsyche grandis TaxID=121162 RepID=UPI00406DA158